MNFIRSVMALATVASGTLFADVTTYTWQGTGTTDADNKWSRAANWSGGVAPSANETCAIVIPAVTHTRLENDISGLKFTSLALTAPTVFTLAGNAVAFTAAGSVACSAANKTVSMPFALAAGATNKFDVAQDIVLTLENSSGAVLTGTGALGKTGYGTLALNTANTYSGGTSLTGGFITLAHAQGFGQQMTHVYIGSNHFYDDTAAKAAGQPSKNDVQVRVTQAMEFRYHVDVARQHNNIWYGNRTAIVFTGGTSVYGDVDLSLKNGDYACNYLGAAPLAVYGTVRIGRLVSFLDGSAGGSGYTDLYGPVVHDTKNTAPYATGTVLLQGACRPPRFWNTGNTFKTIEFGYGSAFCMAAHVLPTNCVLYGENYGSSTASLELNGFDQTFRSLSSAFGTDGTSCLKYLKNTTETPCRVTLRPTASATAHWLLQGPYSLAIDACSPNATQTFVKVVSTMTGSLAVSNGCFRLANAASFPNVHTIELGATGRIILESGTALGNGDVILRKTEGGIFALGEGVQIIANCLQDPDGTIDKTAYNKTFCAVGAGVSGAVEADWIAGGGTVMVKSNLPADDPHTWTGGAGAGAANEVMTNPLNWGLAAGTTPPSLTAGGLVPTFATGGTNAIFGGALNTKGIVFDSSGDFTVRGGGAAVVTVAGDVTAAGAHTYTLDAHANLALGQTWTVSDQGGELVFASGVESEADYRVQKAGPGTASLHGTVSLDGNIDIADNGTLAFRNAHVTSTKGKITELTTTARILLDNAVVDKPLDILARPAIRTADESANVVNGYVTLLDGVSVLIGSDSRLTFTGGIGNGYYSSFSGEGADFSTLVVTNKPLKSQDWSFGNLSAHFWCAGNEFNDYMPIYSGARVYLHVENAVSKGSPVYIQGLIDLCGLAQQFGTVKSTRDTGVVTSASPAVLTVYQGWGAHTDSINTDMACRFRDCAGLCKRGSRRLGIASANDTKGSLEVAEGELAFTSTGSWGGTNVCVSADGALLTLAASGNLNKDATLRITAPGARVSIPTGVTACLSGLYVPSLSQPDPQTGAVTTNIVRLAAGRYTSATCSYLTGGGTIEVFNRIGFIAVWR